MTPFRLSACLALCLATTACGPTTYSLAGRAPFLGADALVEVEEDGGNRAVDVTLTNLFPASRVSPDLNHYVLWLAPVGGTPQRASVLVYDADDREGTAHATFPDARFTVIVTAEAQATVSTPSTHVVFQQQVDDR